jgi:hypothetical protein
MSPNEPERFHGSHSNLHLQTLHSRRNPISNASHHINTEDKLTMSLCISRAVRRQAQLVSLPRTALRNASSTAEAANTAKAKTSEAASKASEGLSRVTSSAGSAVNKVGSSVANVLGGIGGRTGRLIGFVSCRFLSPTMPSWRRKSQLMQLETPRTNKNSVDPPNDILL